MDESEVKSLIRILTVGSRVLATRALVFIVTTMTFGIFVWVMYDPNYIRVVTAVAFALLALWPVMRLDKEVNHEKTNH